MINYVVITLRATRRNNVVLSILSRKKKKSFGELFKNIYLPGHFSGVSESIV